VRLPVVPPVKPMLSAARDDVPEQPSEGQGGRWLYEPKWDGFRCLVFSDGEEVVLGSRNERPLTRYFPEVVEAVRAELPPRCVVDGELVVPRRVPGPDGDQATGHDRLDWDALGQRIHPAESRVRMLAEKTPAHFIAFDLLALGDESLMEQPFGVRRRRLEEAMAAAGPSCHLTAVTDDPALAREWFATFEGAGLDGVVAKPVDMPYLPDQRVMVKVKHHRTAECVVIGYRRHKSGEGIGSMLLGLYAPAADDGWDWGADWGPGWGREGGRRLHMVGAAAAFTVARRRELLAELEPLRVGPDVVAGGEPNRWNARKDNTWVPLRPELVVEVEYDQMEGDRFRHAARFLRWRPDKRPEQCGYDQLEVPGRYDLAAVLAE